MMAYTWETMNNDTYIHACMYVCSVQFSSRWYPCTQKSQYVLHPVSQKFSQCHLWNGFNVRLIDDDPFSSFQGKLSSTSSFHSSLFQRISGAMPLALCPQVVAQVPQHFWKASHLRQLLCPPVYLLSHFPSLQHVQGSTPTVFKGGCQPLTHSRMTNPLWHVWAHMGFPERFYHFELNRTELDCTLGTLFFHSSGNSFFGLVTHFPIVLFHADFQR